jgi:purine-binding chemotaxis protein CheW
MTTPVAHDSVQARIEALERRVLDLRRELRPHIEPIPRTPFEALEVWADGQGYLLPVEPVRQVLPAMWPSPLPDAPEWVRGTFRYGQVPVPLVDLGMRLHGTRRPLGRDDVVVLLDQPVWRGIQVDSVGEVRSIDPATLAPPPPGIPQAPFLVASWPRPPTTTMHLLAVGRLGKEFTLDDA